MRLAGIKAFVLLFVVAGCRTNDSSEVKDLSDMTGSLSNGHGGFLVTCRDGSSAEYTQAEFQAKIASNTICNGTDGSPSNQYFCASSNGTARIGRISTGDILGSDLSLQDCQQSLQASRGSLVCIGTSGGTRVFNGDSGSQLGTDQALSACTNAVVSSRSGVVCAATSSTASRIHRLSDGLQISTDVVHEICHKLTAASRAGLVCSPVDSLQSRVTRISNQQQLGGSVPHLQCVDSIPQ